MPVVSFPRSSNGRDVWFLRVVFGTPVANITLREDAVNSADAKLHSYCVSAEDYIAAVDCEFEKS